MANTKISDLTELTTPVSGDVIPIVDNIGNPSQTETKQVTVDNLILSSEQTLTRKTLTDCLANTRTVGDSSLKIATTAFVTTAVEASDTLAEILANGNTTGATDIVVTAGQAITTDTISETTAASGVTIDGVVLKDTAVTTGAWNGTTVAVDYGGTGFDSFTSGDILYGSGSTLAKLAKGDDGDTLTLDSGLPAWSATTGDITAVEAGTNLNGGGTSGAVTLNLDDPVIADVTGNLTGNADTVTTNANLTGDVTSSGNATTYNNVIPVAKGGTTLTGFTAGDILYADTTTTLAKLAKPGTPAGEVLTFATSASAPSWVAPTTGDITGLTEGTNITITSATGPVPTINVDNPLVADVTGDLTGNADTVTNGVYTTNNLSVLAATTSAQLAGVISDETGSGSLVFASSPTLVTPALGTPASGVATNLTGTAASLTAGTVTTNANLTGDVTSVGNATTLGTVAVTKGGTNITSYTVGDILYADTTTTLAKLAASTDGYVLTATGAGAAPAWEAAAGGDVTKVGTPIDSQVAVWTGDGPIEGTSGLVFDSTGLGIGTTPASTYQLDVKAASGSGNIRVTGASGSDASVLLNEAGTGNVAKLQWDASESYLNIQTLENNSDILLTPHGTGNVGIGVTDPDAELEINGQIKIVDGTEDTDFVLTCDADGLAEWKAAAGGDVEGTAVLSTGETGASKFLREDGDGTCSWVTGTGAIGIGTTVTSGTEGSVIFLDSSNQLAQDNDKLFWDATNFRLGIGTDAATPSTPLNVSIARDGATITPALKISTTGGYTTGTGTAIDFGIDQDSYPTWVTGRIAAPRTGGSYGGSLDFYTNDNDSATDLEKRMSIDHVGDCQWYDTSAAVKMTWDASAASLGIGTAAPGAELEVVGQIRVTGSGSASAPALLISDSNSGIFRESTNGVLGISCNGTEVIRFEDTGNVGIGTDSPTGAKLDVRTASTTIIDAGATLNIEENTAWTQGIALYINNADAYAADYASACIGVANSGSGITISSGARVVDNTSSSNGYKTLSGTTAAVYRQDNGAHIFYGNTGVAAANTLFTPTERMTIASDGDVKIVENLGVGGVTPSSMSASTNVVHVHGTNAELKAETDSTGGWAFSHYKSPDGSWTVGMGDADQFRITNSTALTTDSRLVINTDGALGLGGANYGTSGQVLTSAGSAAVPTWEDAGTSLDVESAITATGSSTVTENGNDRWFTFNATSPGGDYTLTLPAASTVTAGRKYTVRVADWDSEFSSDAVIIDANGSDKLYTQYNESTSVTAGGELQWSAANGSPGWMTMTCDGIASWFGDDAMGIFEVI